MMMDLQVFVTRARALGAIEARLVDPAGVGEREGRQGRHLLQLVVGPLVWHGIWSTSAGRYAW